MSAAGYDAWNEALGARYFTEEMAGRPVYLDTDDDVLADVGRGIGAERWWPDLAGSVRDTLHFDGHGALRWHVERANAWRRSAREASESRGGRVSLPPTVALLTLLSRVAGEMGEDGDIAPHAYYPLLGKRLDLSAQQQAELTTAYQKWAELLWRTLNDYLSLTDGLVGTPTAYSLGHRYVGLPQSQALVRAVDRVRLPRLFQRFGLTPGSDMVPSDMARLLGTWVTQNPSPVSANLRHLWDRATARERIASIVANELASWDGTLPAIHGDDRAAVGTLAVSAMLGRGLKGRRLELSFLAAFPGGCSGHLVVESSAEHPRIDVQQVDGSRCRPRFGTVVDLRSLIEGAVTLRDPDKDRAVCRTPRRVVPLRKDDLLGFFVEVERVSLAEDHLLLVKEDSKVVAGVDRMLGGSVGRFGTVFSADGHDGTQALKGVPEGWLLYEAVQVFAAPDVEPSITDLTALVPLTTAQVTFNGGLKLPGRVRKWSSLQPPEVRAVVADSSAVELTLLDGEGDVVHRWTSAQPVLVARLADAGLGDGDYTLRLRGGGKDLAEHTLRLRSSDTPDAISWETASRLVHGLDAAWGALSAEPMDADSEVTVVADGPWVTVVDTSAPPTPAPTSPSWDKALRPAAAPAMGVAVSLGQVDPDSCVVTGSHLLHLPTFYGKSTGPFIEGTCERCGIVKRFPSSPKKKKAKEASEHTPTAHDIDIASLPPIEDVTVDWDDALDSLVHVGGGPLSALDRVAHQIEATSLFADGFLRTLETLALVDVRRDETLQPVEWEVPPTYLAGLSGDRWVLCGVWSRRGRARLGGLVAEAGGRLEAVGHEDQPTVWQVVAASEEALSEMCEREGSWTLVPDAASRMASALPPLSGLRTSLPLLDLPMHKAASWFDVGSASWVPVAAVVRPGAYRLTQSFRTVDVHVDEQELQRRQCRLGTVQLVKHLAARQAGRALLYHHPRSRHLVVPLGADLPGLYGRAAALSSMQRPRASAKLGVLAYPDVAADVAALIADRLVS